VLFINRAFVVDEILIDELAIVVSRPPEEALLFGAAARDSFPARWRLESGVFEVVFNLK
jgi:hypothetical protein